MEEEEGGTIDFQVQNVLYFDESRHEQQKLNFSMFFNFYTQYASTPNMLLENKSQFTWGKKKINWLSLLKESVSFLYVLNQNILHKPFGILKQTNDKGKKATFKIKYFPWQHVFCTKCAFAEIPAVKCVPWNQEKALIFQSLAFYLCIQHVLLSILLLWNMLQN